MGCDHISIQAPGIIWWRHTDTLLISQYKPLSPKAYSKLGAVSISDKTSFEFNRRFGSSIAEPTICQIKRRYDNSNYQSCGYETSRNLTIRYLIGYWNKNPVYDFTNKLTFDLSTSNWSHQLLACTWLHLGITAIVISIMIRFLSRKCLLAMLN